MNIHEIPRMRLQSNKTNPREGRVVWSPTKSLWFTFHTLVALVGGWLTFSYQAVLLSFLFTVSTLCLGHSIGLHRLLIHRSFQCPKWFEYFLVHLGTVVGMGGPFRILYMHDIRDWSQRHSACHAFFIHQSSLWRDFIWQMHYELRLTHPPKFQIEPAVADNRVHQFIERTWMFQQLPWVLLFYALGGVGFVVWGISVRIAISLIGHWLVGYLAHNSGSRDWHLNDHAIQGYNVKYLGLIAMGEAWHNNHHAFPGSARLGLTAHQPDPGWWVLCFLRKIGLVWNIKLPNDLPERPELVPLTTKPELPASNAETRSF